MEIVLDILLFALMMWIYHSVKLYFKMQKLQKKMPFTDVSKFSPERIDNMLAYIEQEEARDPEKIKDNYDNIKNKIHLYADRTSHSIYRFLITFMKLLGLIIYCCIVFVLLKLVITDIPDNEGKGAAIVVIIILMGIVPCFYIMKGGRSEKGE